MEEEVAHLALRNTDSILCCFILGAFPRFLGAFVPLLHAFFSCVHLVWVVTKAPDKTWNLLLADEVSWKRRQNLLRDQTYPPVLHSTSSFAPLLPFATSLTTFSSQQYDLKHIPVRCDVFSKNSPLRGCSSSWWQICHFPKWSNCFRHKAIKKTCDSSFPIKHDDSSYPSKDSISILIIPVLAIMKRFTYSQFPFLFWWSGCRNTQAKQMLRRREWWKKKKTAVPLRRKYVTHKAHGWA